MREIKFRAWDLTNQDGAEMTYFKIGEGFSGMDSCPIMQFTGLLDKNGKEIFEGDIVRCLTAEVDDIFEVKYVHNPRSSGYEVGDDEKYEIIGNIYENPELLKANQE